MSFMLNVVSLKKLPHYDLEHMRKAQASIEVMYPSMLHMLRTEAHHVAQLDLLFAR